jgi:large repetitive protein
LFNLVFVMNEKGGSIFMKQFRQLPLLMSVLLVVQLLFPVIGAFAAELQTPTNLKGTERYPGNVVLEWDAVPTISSYRVYKLDGETKTLMTQVTSNKATLNLSEGTFTFAIASTANGQESQLSNPLTLVIKFPEMQAPNNLRASVQGFTDLLLNWDAASYASYYKIYKVVNGNRELITTTTSTNITLASLPEGEYLYEVTSYSTRFGESQQGSQIGVSIVYPVMQPPTNITYSIQNGNDVSLSWQSAKYANKYNIYKVNNGSRELVASTSNLNFVFSNVPEGNHVYEITSYSYAYKESKTAAQIGFSINLPKLNAPTNLSLSISNGNDGILSWSKVDLVEAYKVYQVINGEKVLLQQTQAQQLSFKNMPEGNYVYEVSAYSSRFGESPTARIEQDLVHPDMQPPTGVQSYAINVNNIYIKWDKSEYANGYKVYQVENGERKLISDTINTFISIPNLSEGNYIYEITSYSDRFGESVLASHVEQEIVYPEIKAPENFKAAVNQEYNSIILWWDEVEYATAYNVYQVIDGKYELLLTTAYPRTQFLNMPEGKYVYIVQATSKYGDSPYSNEATAIVDPDLEAPSAPKASVIGDNVELAWEPVQGAESYNVYEIVDGERVPVGNTTEPELTLEEIKTGNHEYQIVPVSESGIEGEEFATVIVTAEDFDVNPPVTTSNATDVWSQGAFTVELTATDDRSGVARTFYSVNDGEFVEGTGFVVSEEGLNKVMFFSLDNAGNVEEIRTVEVKIDKTAPVTESNVEDGWLNQAFTVDLTATDDLSGVAKTYYSVNGSQFVEGTSFELSEAGIYTVSFYSVDNAGNVEEEKTVEVKVDEKAPETASNVTDAWLNQDFTVELTATDDVSGVAKTFYSVNDGEFVEGTSFVVTEEGLNKVMFFSLDNAGNVEEIRTVEVKIDKTVPVTKSNVEEGWLNQAFTVDLTATDDLSGVAKIYYSVNGSQFVEGTSVELAEEGIHQVSFYSVDNAGNIEEAKTAEVKIDKTAPQVSWNLEEVYALGSNLTIVYEAKDDQSGIAVEQVTVNGQIVPKGESVLLDQFGKYNVQVTVTNNAGLTTTLEKTVDVNLQAILEITPGIIKMNKGEFTARVTLPKGFEPNFDLSSVTLNGVAVIDKGKGSQQQASKGQFKFNREDFDWNKGEVEVEFRGMVNGQLIVAKTTVIVK